jgi:hypothetical protein
MLCEHSTSSIRLREQDAETIINFFLLKSGDSYESSCIAVAVLLFYIHMHTPEADRQTASHRERDRVTNGDMQIQRKRQ